MVPELFELNQNNIIDTKKLDIWSSGIVLFIIITGYVPWTCVKNNKIFKLIRNNKYDIFWKYNNKYSVISDEAKDLLSKIFIVDPSKRITIEDILDHPYCNSQYFLSTNQVK